MGRRCCAPTSKAPPARLAQENHRMAHDHLKHAVAQETRRAGRLLVMTLLGGMLVVSSFIADWLFAGSPVRDAAGQPHIPHSDLIALVGAVMLAIPLVWHAVSHLIAGHAHMDELV